MPRNTELHESMKRGLFEQGEPDVELPPIRRQELATLVEALLIEIAAALANGEVCDDQDHR